MSFFVTDVASTRRARISRGTGALDALRAVAALTRA